MTTTWLLLDFDNCQMATEHLAVPSLIKRFNELYGSQIGSELTYEEFKQHFHGQARESLCANLSKHFGLEVDYPTLYEDREWRMMQMLQHTGVEMADHLVETLEVLQEQGYKFAFVSNNPIQRGLAAMRYATNRQGDRLARFFGTAFFEAGNAQKPKPDVYLHAMEQLGTSAENCYAVEDSPTGVGAAVAAGVVTFGFLAFASNPQEMAQNLTGKGAASCFTDWQELPSLLNKFKN
ncbi:MAG: HAD family phosphatase [Alphaproteobacteria bacterium]|jgi:HAD superfamily hydrolase (TIGR01509 family)|nr:HAD family phosphatase [Alphaproteobacteria bacterium]MBP7729805.1 HAD family phosphatase [Alphaproteobacteria bacterium]